MNTPYILLIGDTFPLTTTFTHFPVVFEECRDDVTSRHAGFLVPLTPDQGAEVQKEADEVTGYIHVDKHGRATRVFGSHYGDDNLDLGVVETSYERHTWRFQVLPWGSRPNVQDWFAFSNNPEIL